MFVHTLYGVRITEWSDLIWIRQLQLQLLLTVQLRLAREERATRETAPWLRLSCLVLSCALFSSAPLSRSSNQHSNINFFAVNSQPKSCSTPKHCRTRVPGQHLGWRKRKYYFDRPQSKTPRMFSLLLFRFLSLLRWCAATHRFPTRFGFMEASLALSSHDEKATDKKPLCCSLLPPARVPVRRHVLAWSPNPRPRH